MTDPTSVVCKPKICETGSGGGLFLPFAESEQEWPDSLRQVLYLVGLLWTFLGVAIVADIFMAAIEKITSQKTRVWSKQKQRHATVTVWNATVANLTLMALGSSAPEILLSVIELLGNDMYSGDLGASTIVGSAAFNLFVICAVCVAAIPSGETRFILDMKVFFVTGFSSVFAYVWLLAIVSGPWSPDAIEPWEGVLTFLFFPVLVVVAYIADKGYLSSGGAAAESARKFCLQSAVALDYAAMDKEIRNKYGYDLPDKDVAALMETEYGENVTRAAYRISAIRFLVGGKKVKLRNAQPVTNTLSVQPITDEAPDMSTYIEFVSGQAMAHEGEGQTVTLDVIKRGGRKDSAVRVHYTTRDGDAKAGEDFEALEGDLDFPAGTSTASVTIKILNDHAAEDDEFFYVDLSDPTCPNGMTKAVLGETKTSTVRIVDDDLPGELAFEREELSLKEGKRDEEIKLKVSRQRGCSGAVSVEYKTEDDSAIQGHDYEPSSGTLLFADGQIESSISVLVKARGRYDASDRFRVVLYEPMGGVKFRKEDDGGEDCAICTVTIEPDEKAKDHIDHVMKIMSRKMAKAEVGHKNWASQFKDAIMVGGDQGELEDGEEYEPPSVYDWIMHIITVFWKVLFAFIPPVDYCGGWLSFGVALGFIGVVTAFIGDLASLLGCVIGIPDGITAVTLVALGTSLPDTFASKNAAVQDQFADASIGNVTGSNSVNVFLGIGLPWMAGAFFWSGQGPDKDEKRWTAWMEKYAGADTKVTTDYPDGNVFVVVAGALAYSVIVFCAFAVVTLGTLVARRRIFGGELGGPTGPKVVTSVLFVGIWFLFLILYIVKAIDALGPCD